MPGRRGPIKPDTQLLPVSVWVCVWLCGCVSVAQDTRTSFQPPILPTTYPHNCPVDRPSCCAGMFV